MKVIIDITGQKIEDGLVGFYDGKTIFFDVPTFLPNTVSFRVWGAELDKDFDWSSYIDLEKDANIRLLKQKAPSDLITIKGYGVLTFNDVVAGEINISPYDNLEFLKDSEGRIVEFKKKWAIDRIDEFCFEYWLDTQIYFPYGACDLRLYAKGKATFEFDTKDCVGYMDYLKNTNKWETFNGYLNDESLSTGTALRRCKEQE
ncbi:hypothetical protein ACSBL2_12545 [Pedobacter sp. AW31-3R]|uniref:hypothetical protein n=1 Tax=Pedobacter sp. AW31-3R TaxID=3445781 RepID=UPI003FA02472